MAEMTVRPLREIAADIRANWPKVNYAAEPYLAAMESLNAITDFYYQDSAKDIVLRFLGNAGAFRGAEARRIKDELRGMLA